jgi:hypothetical protein
MVKGNTLRVHGDKLVSRPAANTTTYVLDVTPAGTQAAICLLCVVGAELIKAWAHQ